MTSRNASLDSMAEILAALSCGERLGKERAAANAALAPDPVAREQQRMVADREAANAALIEARLREIGSDDLEEAFRPFFEAFFQGTAPTDWLEAQAWHYIGDALVRDFADVLIPVLDPVSAQVVSKALADRDEQESFALDEVTRLVAEDPAARERVAAFARRVAGEALTQTRRALDSSDAWSRLLGGPEGEKRLLLDLLQRHRGRLDRLGIEIVE